VKRIRALALLAALGFAAGCGSGHNAGSGQYTATLHNDRPAGPITVTGTATTAISNVKTGTLVRCKDGMSARVPRIGYSVEAGGMSAGPSSSTRTQREGEIELTHLPDGSITVSCPAR
jgi:hypothetical protein